MKYLRLDSIDAIVMFTPSMRHDHVAGCVSDFSGVYSAGFVNQRWQCYGGSRTLNIVSLECDAERLFNAQMKYIRLKSSDDIIAFNSQYLTHLMVASRFGGPDNVQSAGYINNRWECFGQSHILGVSADEDSDSWILRSVFRCMD